MCYYGHERGRKFRPYMLIFIPFAIAAAIFIFGSLLMLLWNAVLPPVLGLHTVTFWQALGILVLSKILFGGFHGGHGHHRSPGYRHGWHGPWMHMNAEEREKWHGKWMHMSPEEREKMKSEWKSRYEHPDKQE